MVVALVLMAFKESACTTENNFLDATNLTNRSDSHEYLHCLPALERTLTGQ